MLYLLMSIKSKKRCSDGASLPAHANRPTKSLCSCDGFAFCDRAATTQLPLLPVESSSASSDNDADHYGSYFWCGSLHRRLILFSHYQVPFCIVIVLLLHWILDRLITASAIIIFIVTFTLSYAKPT